jgi:hypothetical protein
MSEHYIDLDDGTWTAAEAHALYYAGRRRRLFDDADRHHPEDPRRAELAAKAWEAEEQCIQWSALAYERWIGSEDYQQWHELELEKGKAPLN